LNTSKDYVIIYGRKPIAIINHKRKGILRSSQSLPFVTILSNGVAVHYFRSNQRRMIKVLFGLRNKAWTLWSLHTG